MAPYPLETGSHHRLSISAPFYSVQISSPSSMNLWLTSHLSTSYCGWFDSNPYDFLPQMLPQHPPRLPSSFWFTQHTALSDLSLTEIRPCCSPVTKLSWLPCQQNTVLNLKAWLFSFTWADPPSALPPAKHHCIHTNPAILPDQVLEISQALLCPPPPCFYLRSSLGCTALSFPSLFDLLSQT